MALTPAYTIKPTYLSHSLAPVPLTSGPDAVPMRTYDDVKSDEQFDILLIPGGPGARPEVVPYPLSEFITRQASGANYILSVCTGSWILAGTGVLHGKRATTNKKAFKVVKAATSAEILWIPKARWVVDGNIWTSSGVTAGMDMAYAFLIHLVGEEVTSFIRSVVEFNGQGQEDDEFAVIHGLL